jgi:hypothetical protein
MKNWQSRLSRRILLKMAGAAATTFGLLGTRESLAANASGTAKGVDIKVAGYDYDRVRPIMDGQVGIPGARVSFHYEDIYAVNQYAFGTDQKYEASELGLIPFIHYEIRQQRLPRIQPYSRIHLPHFPPSQCFCACGLGY